MDIQMSSWIHGAMQAASGDPLGFHRRHPCDSDSDDEAAMLSKLLGGAGGNIEEDSSDGESAVANAGPSEEGEEGPVVDPDKLPYWFDSRPFQYNGRIFFTSLPGFLLVLSIGGDSLLSLVTLGGLVVYLLQVAGEKRKAVIAVVITFICCHLILIYSIFPLVWSSVFNLLLLLLLNIFAALVGSWMLLQFDYFRHIEPELSKTLETCLFGLFPFVNVVLLSWVLAATSSVILAPYCLLLAGFVIMQFFLTPAWSSFYKVDAPEDDKVTTHVLDPSMVGTLAYIYALTPALVYIFTEAATNYHGLLVFITGIWLELLFISSLSTCLSTLLNLRQYLEMSDIPLDDMIRVRWGTGVVALLCLSPVLHKHGFTIYLLPWLSVGVAIHAFYGFLVRHKKTKMPGLAAGVVLCLLYLFMFTKLPWTFQYYFLSGMLHISQANVLLMVNAGLCIICIYASVYLSSDILGILTLLQTIVVVSSEKVLLYSGAYNVSLHVLSAAISLYFALRLHHTGKLPWQHTWLSISLHLSKVCDLCSVLLLPRLDPDDTFGLQMAVYTQISTLALMLCLTKIFLFDSEKEMSFEMWLFYLWISACLITFSTPSLLVQSYWVLTGQLPTVPNLIATSILLMACICVKMGMMHPESWVGATYIGPVLLAAAAAIFQLQPELSLDWSDVCKWVFVVDMIGWLMWTPVAAWLTSLIALCVLGQVLGFPFGFVLASWAFDNPGTYWLISFSSYGLIVGLCADMALLSWRRVKNLEHKILILFVLLLPCCLTLLLLSFVEGHEADVKNLIAPSIVQITVTLTIVAAILKLLSFREPDHDLTLSGDIKISPLSVVGNACALLAFLASCSLCPVENWQIWYVGCSALLLFLQKDMLLLRGLNHKNYYAPVLYIISAVLWKSTWDYSNYWISKDTIPWLCGCLEMLLLLMTVPIFFVFFTILWNGNFYLSDRVVVFFTPPSVFLFIFGSSMCSWLFSAYTLTVGTWMIMYKLPLHVER